ncbi:DUF6262 family protein [Streptomyces sp. 5.8]|uniref:DUF6262 family protein n=1 Tax=Streptomyces sp. 5.8 TaxID=3406571 RepID=UPI003BB7B703
MTDPRTRGDVLRAARQRDSREKRAKVIAAVDDMKFKGDPITMLAVARAAGVSNWLVYQPEIKEYIQNARKSQTRKAARDATSGARASAASLAVDLELARNELRAVRQERNQLREAMQRNLGHQLDQAGTVELTARVNALLAAKQELEDQLAGMTAERDQLAAAAESAAEEVATVRMAMAQLMRDTNRGP